MIKNNKPVDSTHPGILIKQIMKNSKMGKLKFAKEMGITIRRLNFLFSGHGKITNSLAVNLNKFDERVPSFFTYYQEVYDSKCMLDKENRRISREKYEEYVRKGEEPAGITDDEIIENLVMVRLFNNIRENIKNIKYESCCIEKCGE